VHAFGESVKLALAMLPTELKVERHTLTFVIPYALFERVKKLIEAHHGDLIESQFTDQVTISALFVVEDAAAFAHALKELSGGTIVV
jgi:putative IMPACT (imprinted ancient) family translation regulator